MAARPRVIGCDRTGGGIIGCDAPAAASSPAVPHEVHGLPVPVPHEAVGHTFYASSYWATTHKPELHAYRRKEVCTFIHELHWETLRKNRKSQKQGEMPTVPITVAVTYPNTRADEKKETEVIKVLAEVVIMEAAVCIQDAASSAGPGRVLMHITVLWPSARLVASATLSQPSRWHLARRT